MLHKKIRLLQFSNYCDCTYLCSSIQQVFLFGFRLRFFGCRIIRLGTGEHNTDTVHNNCDPNDTKSDVIRKFGLDQITGSFLVTLINKKAEFSCILLSHFPLLAGI